MSPAKGLLSQVPFQVLPQMLENASKPTARCGRGRPALALYQPDQAANVGAAMRLCACLNVTLHIIEPCGFPFDPRRLKRTALDYYGHTALVRHTSYAAFDATLAGANRRLVLLTTKAQTAYTAASLCADDMLLFGQESAGVPDLVHERADLRLRIPLKRGLRSLNLVTAAAMVLGEALRQCDGFAELD